MVVVVVGMMSESASAVVRRGVAVFIMVVMNRREDVDVEAVSGAEEVRMQEEMMEEVATSEGCRMVDGVDGVGGALLRRRLGHLCGGMLRLTGGDRLLSSFLLLTQCFIYDYDTCGTLPVR
jgi:hypothetical protein